MISAKFLSNVRSLALLAMFEPFLATVKFVVAAAPVPSLITTKSPALGEAGRVIVILPAVATINCLEVAVRLVPVSVGAGIAPAKVNLPDPFVWR